MDTTSEMEKTLQSVIFLQRKKSADTRMTYLVVIHEETRHIITTFVFVLILDAKRVSTYAITDLTDNLWTQDIVIHMGDSNC